MFQVFTLAAQYETYEDHASRLTIMGELQMREACRILLLLSVAAAMCLLAATATYSEPVDGTWENADTFGNGPFSSTTSNTFVLGDDPNDPFTNSNAATQEMIFSPFTQMTLDSAGDK